MQLAFQLALLLAEDFNARLLLAKDVELAGHLCVGALQLAHVLGLPVQLLADDPPVFRLVILHGAPLPRAEFVVLSL